MFRLTSVIKDFKHGIFKHHIQSSGFKGQKCLKDRNHCTEMTERQQGLNRIVTLQSQTGLLLLYSSYTVTMWCYIYFWVCSGTTLSNFQQFPSIKHTFYLAAPLALTPKRTQPVQQETHNNGSQH